VSKRWVVLPGSKFRLADVDPSSTDGAPGGKAKTNVALAELHEQFRGLQDRLWAEEKRSLLVVLQAMDTGGKDGTIKHVFGGALPQATRVVSFKEPTPVELAHDFLWRVHIQTPRAGETAIFNRSHYEEVLIVRVHKLVPDEVWHARYELINDFEQALAGGGTTIVKLFLHISKDEQRRRLQARLDSPDKRWKFKATDLDERKLWDDYQAAYEDALRKTSTERAPWYVIPADHKWYRNWAVSNVLIDTLRAMDPRYPDPPELAGIVID
jgi:PPK2 family polyphosphate:nucleotide phosphotransferase